MRIGRRVSSSTGWSGRSGEGAMGSVSRRSATRKRWAVWPRAFEASSTPQKAEPPRSASDQAWELCAFAQQPPEHVPQDPAVLEVLALARGVEADAGPELLLVRSHGDLARLPVLDALDGELLATRHAEGLRVLAVHELQRQDSHHQQVRAMDPLVRLRDHRADAEQVRALRRPVARRARSVLLARDHEQGRALVDVAL